jgi:hypothetical protein
VSLWKLASAVQQLDLYLDETKEPDLERIRPLVHRISEAYLNYAFTTYNKELTLPE